MRTDRRRIDFVKLTAEIRKRIAEVDAGGETGDQKRSIVAKHAARWVDEQINPRLSASLGASFGPLGALVGRALDNVIEAADGPAALAFAGVIEGIVEAEYQRFKAANTKAATRKGADKGAR
jgi:hypothetical protein